MARQHIEHHATTSADPAIVYALLRDGAGWPSWSPIDSFALERPGVDEPEGIGALRRFRKGRITGHDQIVELVAGRRFSYTHTSSLPVRDYRGDVDLEPLAGGTAIRWAVAFDPKLPGTGRLLRRALDGFVEQLTDGLARRADAVAGGTAPPSTMLGDAPVRRTAA
jgi:polyketide cyclase/dehydrase/lipid transport protein